MEPFPVEALPKKLQRFVTSVAKALPCPPDFPGVMMLPVLGAAVGLKRRVQVKERWLRNALDAVVTGKAVPLAETKAFGRGIKFRNTTS